MSFIQINLQEMKVLVVDDSTTARKILTEMLHEIGIGHTSGAADGAEAIERLRTFTADIMLCDLHMAPLNGIGLTRLMRNASDSPNPYLPIVMLSSDATQAQIKNAMNAGVNAFMSKPVKMMDLHRRMLAIFSRPQVYIRDGRTLRPVLATQTCDAAAEPPRPAKTPPLKAASPRGALPRVALPRTAPPEAARPPAPSEDGGEEPADSTQRPLTRGDMGLC